MKSNIILYSFFCLIFLSCSEFEDDNAYNEMLKNPELFQASIQNLTDIIVYDIFSPPVASRVYLYPIVAAYEVARLATPLKYNSLVGQVKDLTALPKQI